MLKLLIAEGNEELRQALAQELAADFIVKLCADGAQVQNAMQDFRPDLMVLDLMLPCVDGITLLQKFSEAAMLPTTLVTAAFTSPYILSALQKYHVAYLMAKPCSISALTCQLRELAATIEEKPRPCTDPALPLSAILMELGLAPKVDGFSYLLSAIPMYMHDPKQGLTKELYTAVGHAFDKNGQQVERSMRSAIHSAWARGDMRIWQRYFSMAPDGSVSRPSNGDFISRIAAYLSSQDLSRTA